MKELFVPYKLSLLAKEKGFDEPCFGYYNGKGLLRYAGTTDENLRTGGMDTEEMRNQSLNSKYCSAPLYQQLIDWFEIKGYSINVFPITKTTYGYAIEFMRTLPNEYNESDYWENTNTKQIIDQILEEEKLKGWKNALIKEQATFKYSRKEATNKAFEEAFKLIP